MRKYKKRKSPADCADFPRKSKKSAFTRSLLSLRLTYYCYSSRKVDSRLPRPAFFSGQLTYPDFIRILNALNLQFYGLFSSKTELK